VTPGDAAATAAARPTEQPGLSKPPVQAAVVLVCTFVLVMLFVAMAFETSHPMGPSSGTLATVNHWAIITAVVIVIVLLGMLLYSSARRPGTTIDVFAGVLKATLAVVSG